MFAEAIESILRDKCTPADVRGIERGEKDAALWREFSGAGFLDLLKREEDGGAGLSLMELYPVIFLLGRYAAPMPMAQAVAARALVDAGVVLPEGSLTLASQIERGIDGMITCSQLPFGLTAQYVLAAEGNHLLLLDAAQATRKGAGILGSQVGTLTWQPGSASLALAGAGDSLAFFAAAIHAGLIAGAMTRVFEMTLAFCNDRQQFGKTLGKFQAVQHQLSVMAEQVASVSVAAEAAFDNDRRVPRPIAAAIAKARASEAVVPVANIAHALHGAIGITEEYDLQLFTRRLHEWRMAHGAEGFWNRMIGEAVLAGSDSVAEFARSA